MVNEYSVGAKLDPDAHAAAPCEPADVLDAIDAAPR
jgi:hypothetical protein